MQPLDRRNGQVFFLKFRYADDKGEVRKGDWMLSPQSGYNVSNFSGERVLGENLGKTKTSSQTISDKSLSYAPVIPGTVHIYDGVKEAHDEDKGDGTGIIRGDLVAAGDGSTINYTTGALNLVLAAGAVDDADILVDWDYDLNSFDAQVSEIETMVVSEPVIARPRKLKSIYMFDVAYDLKMSFGLDMDQVIMKATSGEIGFEIDNEIMIDLLKIAATSSTWNKNPQYKSMDIRSYTMTIIDAINDASNVILGKTKRYEATFVVVGRHGATAIEGLGKEYFARVSTGGAVNGPHLVGILDNKYKVYKNPNYKDNQVLVGARGEMFIEAGYIYAPYIPLFATQLLVDENFRARRGFCTVYAKKVVNPNMYHSITILDNAQETPFDVTTP